jgi:hypothetical protein
VGRHYRSGKSATITSLWFTPDELGELQTIVMKGLAEGTLPLQKSGKYAGRFRLNLVRYDNSASCSEGNLGIHRAGVKGTATPSIAPLMSAAAENETAMLADLPTDETVQ